jgi:hypothetical protein
VSKALLQYRVLQGLDNMVLTQNIVENLGSIFSRKNLIGHIYNVARICPVPQESDTNPSRGLSERIAQAATLSRGFPISMSTVKKLFRTAKQVRTQQRLTGRYRLVSTMAQSY